MNVSALLARSAAHSPERCALWFEGRAISYATLQQRVQRVASALAAGGVAPGDRVALLLPNTPDFVASYYAALLLGAIVVSINPLLKGDEIGFLLQDSGTSTLITESVLISRVPSAWRPRHTLVVETSTAFADGGASRSAPRQSDILACRDISANTPAAILYTSGTTGQPKGVVLSHGNILSNVAAAVKGCGIRTADGLLLFVPLSHCFGQNAVLNCGIAAGATIVLHRRFAIEDILDNILARRITKLYAVPAVYVRLLEAGLYDRDLATVPYYFSAAAVLPEHVEQAWQRRIGRPIHQGYGLTETSPFATYNVHPCRHAGSVGLPIDDVAIAILGPEGITAAPDVVGEIVIRGPNVMLGYWNRPRETAAALYEGWFRSGDVGRLDAAGRLFVVDRLKDLVNSGGYKIAPVAVEHVLAQHPAVSEAAVFGAPDAIYGEQVRAAVTLRPGHDVSPDELVSFCRERMAGYKVPRVIAVVPALPRTSTGKVLKRVLAAESCLQEARS